MRAGLFIRRLVTVIILFLYVSSFNSAFAADWTLTADDTQGLTAAPADSSDGSPLFDITRMTPGDSETAAVTVKNNCTFAFSLTVEVLSLNEVPGLAEQLVIEVYRNGALLDSFPGIGKYTFADSFGSNTETVLVFEVTLPGPSTDNRFQNKEAALQWIFTADGDDGGKDNGGGGSGGGSGGSSRNAPADGSAEETYTLVEPLAVPLAMYDMPKTGEAPLWYSIVLGSAMILLGVLLLQKEKRKKRAQQL